MSIRVYIGQGTSQFGAPLLVRELQKHLGVPVSGITSHEMRTTEAWKHETSTLIFAGQSVGKFKEALGEDVMSAIKSGVFEGRFNYIGICAGAAFAADKIKYRIRDPKTQEDRTIENTGLSMFFGMASGPARSVCEVPFSGKTENLHLVRLQNANRRETSGVFHWGGPALIPYERITAEQGKLLWFLKDGETAMSYHVRYGAGNVYLYSYHPEIHAGNVREWAQTRRLDNTEASRIETAVQFLDANAFQKFLMETGLEPAVPLPKKEAASAAPFYNLNHL